jgi:hypothetical protein
MTPKHGCGAVPAARAWPACLGIHWSTEEPEHSWITVGSLLVNSMVGVTSMIEDAQSADVLERVHAVAATKLWMVVSGVAGSAVILHCRNDLRSRADRAAAKFSPHRPKRECWRGGACCCVARSAIPANIARRDSRRRYVRDTKVFWKLVEIQSYSIIGALLMAFSCVS